MNFTFTVAIVKELLGGNAKAKKWHTVLNDILPKYDINTTARVAGFISQCAHESNNFKRLEENLNYSAKRLRVVFPRYFRTKNPADYAKNPEVLANYVYMDKNRSWHSALGNVHDGDGWLFRGRGLIQLTGRNNYATFGKSINMSAEEAVEYVSTPEGAVESACWFWEHRKLNIAADDYNVERMTKIINGGVVGLKDREKRFRLALVLFSDIEFLQEVDKNVALLHQGSEGLLVKQLQLALGIASDGDYGPKTYRAVVKWQERHRSIPTGKVDYLTFALMIK